MKKLLTLILVFIISLPIYAQRQAHTGVEIGGVSMNTDIETVNEKNIVQLSAGLMHRGNLLLGFGYKLGARVVADRYDILSTNIAKLDKNAFSAEIPFQLNWGIKIFGVRPFAFVEPSAALRFASGEGKQNLNALKQKLTYNISSGVGLSVGRIQASLGYGWQYGHIFADNGKVNDVLESFEESVKGNRDFDMLTFTMGFYF